MFTKRQTTKGGEKATTTTTYKILIITNQHKKRTYRNVDFAFPVDNRGKLKECEKNDKYLDLAWELKKQWNMKVRIIPIVIGII